VDIEVKSLVAQLVAHQCIKRTDPAAKKALTNESFREELDSRLAACGLILLEHPYSDYIGIGLMHDVQESVMEHNGEWASNNIHLPRDAIALLVILWALIILPKRERQRQRIEDKEAVVQSQMFAEEKSIPRGKDVADTVKLSSLISDFSDRIGKSTKVKLNLARLKRFRFIEVRKEVIFEGPMLDLAFDYGEMAGRILDGAMTDILAGKTGPADSTEDEEKETGNV
jgi:hypothetical protein